MKAIFKFPHETPKLMDKYNNSYFTNLIQSYIVDGGILLGWLCFGDRNYYMLDIEDDPNFKSATPIIFIDRSTHLYPVADQEEYKDIDTIVKQYPYILQTIGCDDGSLGWRFSSKQEVNNWLSQLIYDLNTDIDFRDGYEFFDFYDEAQVSFN